MWLRKRNGKVYPLFLGKPFSYTICDPISPPSIPFTSSSLTQPFVLSLLKKVKKTHLYQHINSTETETKSYKQKTYKRKIMPKTNKKAKGEKNTYKDNYESVLCAGELLLGLSTAKSDRSCNHLHNVIGPRNIAIASFPQLHRLKSTKYMEILHASVSNWNNYFTL